MQEGTFCADFGVSIPRSRGVALQDKHEEEVVRLLFPFSARQGGERQAPKCTYLVSKLRLQLLSPH